MKTLVTGGGGFLGRAIVERLLAEGHEVRSLARGEYPFLREMGVDAQRGDIADATQVSAAVEGVDAVFHVAAKAGVWGSYESYRRPNVDGTKNVIAACRQHGVRDLIHTSSPSVIHGGGDVDGLDESAPYPDTFDAPYPETKAEAERLVLAAHGDELRVIALRPHLIWGPRDVQFIPRLVSRARSKRLRLLSGKAKLIDTVYIDNAVDAHMLAWDALRDGSEACGRAFFITNHEPVPSDEFILALLDAVRVPWKEKRISPRVAYAAASVMESTYRALRIKSEPPLTRFIVKQLATAHHYDPTNAIEVLGYKPRISNAEGLAKLREWAEATGL